MLPGLVIDMKQLFKFNPLATAIVTILCSSITAVHAETPQPTRKPDNNSLNDKIKQADAAQRFYSTYYVDQASAEAQQRKQANTQFCQGTWLTPIDPNTKATDPSQATSVITADYAIYNPNGDSELEGNVVIEQPGRRVVADKVSIDQTQTFAKAEGNVQLAQNGLVTQSESVNYNLKTQTGDLKNSLYIVEQQHAHGAASEIARTSANKISLKNASYSTCPPSKNPVWNIKAKQIELNQATGRGSTVGTTLYVKDVPVLAVPYFNFPIDDRRTTGILSPNFGYTNDGGLQLAVPVYLNLAPNYDATITPRFLGGRGAMLDGEFRYLTENFGAGKLSGGILPSDEQFNNQDRKDFHFLHAWNMNRYLTSNFEYNYASDKDYFADLNNNPDSSTALNLRRAAEIRYKNQIPGLKALLKVESFQTLDPDVKDEDKPYARLPQLLVNYVTGNPQGFQFEINNDTAYFSKPINDNSTSLETSGTRIYNDVSVRYNYRSPWAFAIPKASLRSVNTFFDQASREDRGIAAASFDKSVVVPQFTLDTGLTFERQGNYLQTISPRVFYAYAPFEDQRDYPNFDTIAASISYDQLFNASRFYGHDRLDDNNFASVGLSYSLFDDIGLERLRASVGQSFYFEDRRVLLNVNDAPATDSNSGPILSLSSQLSNNITFAANHAWQPDGTTAQSNVQLYYSQPTGNLYNVGYFHRKQLNTQQAYDQVVASFIQPIQDNFRMLGHVQYDLKNSVAREYLLGLNYESCCWGVSVYGRSFFNDLDNPNDPNVNVKRSIMAEITLKGLGGFNNKLSSILENRVYGFNTINQSWTKR